MLRCSAAKQAREVRDQPYFRKGVNAGDESSEDGESSGGVLSSREKRALLEKLSDQEFWEFLDKVSALPGSGLEILRLSFVSVQAIIVGGTKASAIVCGAFSGGGGCRRCK